MAGSLPEDTRGIIDPAAMMRHVDFARFPAGDALDGLVEWFWSVAWDLPAGSVLDQQVLNHPAGNISVGTLDDGGVRLDPPEGRVYGVATGVSERHIAANGWTVAARTTVGGLGVFLDAPAKTATDAQLTFATALPGIDGAGAVSVVSVESENEARVDVLRTVLGDLVSRREPVLVSEAREIWAVARLAEHDRSVCRVEAAEAARAAINLGKQWQGWATVAAELGYADQAHLGTSPSAYLARTTNQ
ncbi:MAG: hypothetical protein ACI8TP_002393 [Acidimicrobiales bacterium]|jgi:hypothetical protein